MLMGKRSKYKVAHLNLIGLEHVFHLGPGTGNINAFQSRVNLEEELATSDVFFISSHQAFFLWVIFIRMWSQKYRSRKV
jgi:hypothetical protein